MSWLFGGCSRPKIVFLRCSSLDLIGEGVNNALTPRKVATMPSQFVKTFYTSERALKRHFVERGLRMRFRSGSASAAKTWQAKARKLFAELIGLQHFKRVVPLVRKIGSVKMEGLVREEWRFQSERDVWVPFYLFIPQPKGTNGSKLPLVLCPHGHGSSGKWATAGRRDIAEMRETIEGHNYDYGVQFARAGFITACPDARGFGERREPNKQGDKALLNSSCHELTLAGAPLGLTVQGMWTWDLMRLIDLLCKDPRVDSKRIGCAGLSGGGMQTLDLAAIDTRVKAAVVSGYFYGVREALQVTNGHCMCNMVPHLWEHFDMGDIAALIAPRGLLIETGDADPLNGASNLANVKSQVAITRKTFAAFGVSSKLRHHIFKGNHRWSGEEAIPWMKEMLTDLKK
jgi:hypothetical protein